MMTPRIQGSPPDGGPSKAGSNHLQAQSLAVLRSFDPSGGLRWDLGVAMAQPRTRAVFFCRTDGVVIVKAPPLHPTQRRRVFEKFEYKCANCHIQVQDGGVWKTPYEPGPRTGHVDHIIPRSRGGQNTTRNLQVLCHHCNCAKGAK